MKELEEENYYLKKKGQILKELVRNYQSQFRILKDFILIVFILEQVVVGLYLLELFDNSNICIIIF